MRLEAFPTEIIHLICKLLDIDDLRRLRLISQRIGEIANTYALSELIFCLCKTDLDFLDAVANDPGYAGHVTSLTYVAEVLDTRCNNFTKYRDSARACEGMVSRIRPLERASDEDMQSSFAHYKRLVQEQDEIVTRVRDYDVLKQLIAKLPRLREVVVSSDNELRNMKKSPFHFVLCDGVRMGGLKDDGASRHMRAIMHGVQAAGTQLKTLRAAAIHHEFFDNQYFGLHSMGDLLGNLTSFEIVIMSADDERSRVPIVDQLASCREVMQKGVIRNALARMPQLKRLEIIFTECFHRPNPDFPAPAILAEILPLDMTWSNLEYLSLGKVETTRQELARLVFRHKASLHALWLRDIDLGYTSWLRFLSQIKNGLECHHMDIAICGTAIGKSEEDDGLPESWFLGGHDYAPERIQPALSDRISTYLADPKESCPLGEHNMGMLSDWDPESSNPEPSDLDEGEWEGLFGEEQFLEEQFLEEDDWDEGFGGFYGGFVAD